MGPIHSTGKTMRDLAATTSTVASAQLAGLGWLPIEAKLPRVVSQFTTKWKLVLIQNGMSNFKIIQFGSKNARSGTHRVFPIRIPMNTIWCVSSFLIPCNFHSTTIWSGWPFFDFPNSCFPDKMCVNRTLYPTLTNPPDIYIQFGEKFRGTDTNGITGKTRCRIPVKTTLQNASTQR